VLCHVDFHPGNVLFGEDDEVTGVVDGAALKRGPALSDVADCRAHLAVLGGIALADAFTEHYAARCAVDESLLASWDVFAGAHALQWAPHTVAAFVDSGASSPSTWRCTGPRRS
jgi:Ser/Thr protein kinase RdoA (MazF antagonist)